jgi:hypothetical protein
MLTDLKVDANGDFLPNFVSNVEVSGLTFSEAEYNMVFLSDSERVTFTDCIFQVCIIIVRNASNPATRAETNFSLTLSLSVSLSVCLSVYLSRT